MTRLDGQTWHTIALHCATLRGSARGYGEGQAKGGLSVQIGGRIDEIGGNEGNDPWLSELPQIESVAAIRWRRLARGR